MKTRIENLIKVAQYLEDSGTKALLERWRMTIKSGDKPLPFIGRFSAGKSSLINALIGTRILPTARIETTAVLTSIKYAQTSSAEIFLTDNKHKSIDISEVADLRHGKIDRPEEEISSIEIGIPSDLLTSGLKIIDSPGMDTVVNNHVTLARYIMNEAVIVVYVMSGAPSDFDMGILRQLQANGTGIVVVRTHMEEIGMKNEESFISAVESDENILAGLPERVAYFPLTTVPDAVGAAKNEFDRFRKYLKDEIILKMDDIYNTRLSRRLDSIADRFKEELMRRKSLLQNNADKSIAEYEADIMAINKAIRKTESSIDAMQSKLSREKISLKAEILEDVSDECENTVKRFKRNLSDSAMSFVSDSAMGKCMNELFQKTLAETSEEIGTQVTSNLATWAAKSVSETSINLSEISVGLSKINIEFDPDLDLDKVRDIAEQQEAMIEKIDMLTSQFEEFSTYSDSRLSAMGIRREEIQQTLQNLNATHKEALDAINYLDNNYEPRYITKPSKTGALMRKIGSVGDIAMLAIPAIGWEKGATMLAGKAATLAGKTGKMAQIGQSVLTAGSNAAKIMASTDTAKDMVMLLDMTTKTINNQDCDKAKSALVKISDSIGSSVPVIMSPEKKKQSMFDYLSLSYWFGKFGEWIDPPKQEIDMEYEHRYQEARLACEQKAFQIARTRINEERELGRIKNEVEAIEMERRFRQECLDREKIQCEKQIEKITRKKDEALRQAFMVSAVSQFRDATRKIEKHIEHNLDGIMDDIYLQILSSASQSAYSQLSQSRAQLEMMMEAKLSTQKDTMAPVATIDGMLQLLN